MDENISLLKFLNKEFTLYSHLWGRGQDRQLSVVIQIKNLRLNPILEFYFIFLRKLSTIRCKQVF